MMSVGAAQKLCCVALNTDHLWYERCKDVSLAKVLGVQMVILQASLATWVLRLDAIAFVTKGWACHYPMVVLPAVWG